jgi:hypothetical protein
MNMPETQFHKGDRVKFKLGTRSVQGLVKEDRGPIGIRGRHLYLVEFRAEPQSPSQIELPADQMEPVQAAVATK